MVTTPARSEATYSCSVVQTCVLTSKLADEPRCKSNGKSEPVIGHQNDEQVMWLDMVQARNRCSHGGKSSIRVSSRMDICALGILEILGIKVVAFESVRWGGSKARWRAISAHSHRGGVTFGSSRGGKHCLESN